MSKIELAHPYLETIQPYEPPDLEEAAARADVEVDQLIRLDANENPFGPSPKVAQALASFDEYHLHPDYQPLKEAVGRYAGVPPEQVVLSNGADEMIDMLIRLFVEPSQTLRRNSSGRAVVTCPPTFSMYRFYARVNRCRVLTAPRREDLSLDVAAVEQTVQGSEDEAALLFLVSPGNPSGRVIPLDVIQRLLALPVTVAVDEAYVEFGGESAVPLLSDHDNLVIIRTFSKWAGMAGLRLGYALLAPRLADYLERIRAPYNVNAAAMVAALATFADLEAVQVNVARLIAERERLREGLAAIPWLEPLPTQTNFALCRLRDHTSQEVADALIRRGILIRTFSSPAMAEYIRITVGRPDQNDALLTALQALDQEG